MNKYVAMLDWTRPCWMSEAVVYGESGQKNADISNNVPNVMGKCESKGKEFQPKKTIAVWIRYTCSNTNGILYSHIRVSTTENQTARPANEAAIKR